MARFRLPHSGAVMDPGRRRLDYEPDDAKACSALERLHYDRRQTCNNVP
jgi:hypothetical protein